MAMRGIIVNRTLVLREKKIIEGILHPTPKIKGYNITHRHVGQYIYFSAWQGDNRLNDKEFRVHRQEVLNDKTFYHRYLQDLGWLTQED